MQAPPLPPDDATAPAGHAAGSSRRSFLKQSGTLLGAALAPPLLGAADALAAAGPVAAATVQGMSEIRLKINGTARSLRAEPRTSLLDALREYLDLTGSKKGCDHGQCGACTVLVDGHRINSCLSLAIMNQGKEITTIEGLAKGGELHPMQAAFLKHDGFQCGYCTPGQIMSAVACVKEGHAGSDEQTREWMSGNLCRCGAYPNIVAAVREVNG